MKNTKTSKSQIAIATSAALFASMTAVPSASATENPFALDSLTTGYLVTSNHTSKHDEGKCGGAKHTEGRCGGVKPQAVNEPTKNDIPHIQSIPYSSGSIRKIDLANSKITIKHEELINLGMPPMTMVFKVDTSAITALKGLNVGDPITFQVLSIDGVYTILTIRKK